MEKSFGWVGKVLRVNLTDESVGTVPTKHYRPEQFIGGVGLNAKIFWDLGCPQVGAFDPLNPLIISTGPLTGIYGPFGRGEVCSISPQCYPDELYTYSGFGGKFPSEMKYAGYDAMVIVGKANRPVYISIHDAKVEIKDATHLWGKDTFEAQQTLMADDPEASVLVTGPAGENLSRIAIILNETECAAGQGGFGAVMGSKNLKAISVRGTGAIAVAKPDHLMELTKPIVEENRNNPTGSVFRPPTFGPQELQDLFTKKYFVKPYGCFGCPQQCRGFHDVPGIGRSGASCVNWLWYLYSPEPEDIWEANVLCQRLGINSFEIMYGIPSLLLQSFMRGVLKSADIRNDIGLPVPKWLSGTSTDHEFLMVLLNKIASGERPYSDGTARFAEHFDGRLSLGGKLIELYGELSTARGYPTHWSNTLGSSLHWATDTRDPVNSCHDYLALPTPDIHKRTTDHFGLPAYDSYQLHDLGKTVYEGAERVTAWVQDNQCLKNSLPVCEYFSLTSNFQDFPEMDLRVFEAKLISAVTGVDMDTQRLAEAGERIGNLIRAIMVKREDRSREDDNVNEPYFKKAIQTTVTSMGNTGPIDRAKFEALKDSYYEARGWEVSTGRPTRAKLEELGLKDVADELAGIGRLG